MGTRNLTVVFSDGEYKVAQYGQWDGYPDGQGATALEFCQKHLATAYQRQLFKEKLEACRFITEEEHDNLWKRQGLPEHQEVGGMKFSSCNDANHFREVYPSLSRDTGAGILELILNAKAEVPLTNSIEFAGDSLFCEWAYIIDLDKEALEVYKGFNKTSLEPEERFAYLKGEDKYYPIRHLISFSLNDLPDLDGFKRAIGYLVDEQ
jgi:hypothetical protein